MKDKYSVLRTVEYTVYLLVILFFALGRADGLGATSPVIKTVLALFTLAAFLVVIILAKYNGGILANSRSVFLLSLVVIGAVHLTTPLFNEGVYQHSPLYVFYYVALITFASCGNGTLWLTAFSLYMVSELGWFIAIGPWNINKTVSLEMVIRRSMLMLPNIGYAFGAGGIAYFMSTIRMKKDSTRAVGFPSGIAAKSARGVSSSETGTYLSAKTGIQDVRTGLYDTATLQKGLPESDGQKGLRDLSRGEELASVVFFMSRNFNAYSALGFIYDKQKNVFTLNSFHSKSMSIISNVQIPAGVGIVGNLAIEKVSFLSGNITNYNQKLNYYSAPEMINSVLAVPILSFEKELLGALVVDNKDKLAFRDNQKETLNRFSQLAAALITNVRMRRFQERAAQHFQIFYKAAQQFTKVQHIDQVLEILFHMIESLAVFTRIVAIDFHPESTSCTVRKVFSKANDIQEGFSFQLNDGLYVSALKSRQTISIDDFDQYRQKYYRLVPEEVANPNTHSLIIVPLSTTEAFCRGVISVESELPGYFQGEPGQLISTLVSNAAVAYQKAFLYQKMETLATTDGLTQLCNHRTFQGTLQEEVNRATRYKRQLSLLIMDIDHFKNFNDTYGHSVGDLVLKEMSACLKRTLRSNDIPARYGGEEFAVIIPETSPENAMIIGDRVRQNIEALVISTKTEKLHVTVSIGCAGIPEHAATQQQLIDFADTAMYYSKEQGRNKITLYHKKMGMNKSE